MNLIEEIARHVASGLSAAEAAAKLEVEHAVKVSEDWVRKIMSADGFASALDSARTAATAVASVEQAAVGEFDKAETDVAKGVEGFAEAHEQDANDAPAQAEGVDHSGETEANEVAAKTAEGTMVGGKGESSPGAAQGEVPKLGDEQKEGE